MIFFYESIQLKYENENINRVFLHAVACSHGSHLPILFAKSGSNGQSGSRCLKPRAEKPPADFPTMIRSWLLISFNAFLMLLSLVK
jgi:hypothetical protein